MERFKLKFYFATNTLCWNELQNDECASKKNWYSIEYSPIGFKLSHTNKLFSFATTINPVQKKSLATT